MTEIKFDRLTCEFRRVGDELQLLFPDGKGLTLHPKEWSGDSFGMPVSELEKEVEYFKRKLHGQKEKWLYTFAGQAMQGLLGTHEGLKYNYEVRAEWSVRQARALLAELEKEPHDIPR